jgi:tetratricopeptide (TPR) repeat protein
MRWIKADWPTNDYENWTNKGIVLGNLGRSDEALKCFDEAIEINPQFAEGWFNKGVVLKKLHKYDEALVSRQY